jgi:L-ascorbate metabolism protein UlaG (beta-lactamase superfamily)
MTSLLRSHAETASVGDGSVGLAFIGHATVLIEFDGVRVLTDPFLGRRLGPLERHGQLPDVDALRDIDVVVISHGHHDHFDRASLRSIPGRPRIVVPRGLGNAVSKAVGGDVVELEAGEAVDIGGLRVRAVPARHWISPGAARAQPLGYLLDGGSRVYFAGDTGEFPAMRELAGEVDVALLPIWTWGPHLGPGHLGPRSAAEVLSTIRPTAAVPIHWGTLYPVRLHHVWRSPLAEPGDRFAAHAARLAPDVDVRVLPPGGATIIVPRRQ